jgi:hypothetical protein
MQSTDRRNKTLPPANTTGGRRHVLSQLRRGLLGVLGTLGLLVAPLGLPVAAASTAENAASTTDQYFLTASPYSYHFSHNPEHRDVVLLGVERIRAGKDVAGIAFFSNSFGQPSVFLYPWGGIYSGVIRQAPQWYFKWAAGLLYGYKEPYEDKVPLNSNGFSPGLILAIGRPITENINLQANLLGNSGLMIQATFRIR